MILRCLLIGLVIANFAYSEAMPVNHGNFSNPLLQLHDLNHIKDTTDTHKIPGDVQEKEKITPSIITKNEDEPFEKGHNIKEGIEHYRQLLKEDPTNVDYVYKLGNLYVDLRQFREATDLYKQVLKLKPNDPKLMIGYAYAEMSYSNFGTAKEVFLSVLEIDSDNVAALIGLGRIETIKANHKDNVNYFAKTLELVSGYKVPLDISKNDSKKIVSEAPAQIAILTSAEINQNKQEVKVERNQVPFKTNEDPKEIAVNRLDDVKRDPPTVPAIEVPKYEPFFTQESTFEIDPIEDDFYFSDASEIPVRVFNDIYLGYMAGEGFGWGTGYATLGLFTTFASRSFDNFQPFLDARMHVFKSGKRAANLGIGGRYLISDVAFGANLFCDYLHHHRHDFLQLGLGIEVLSNSWDFRVNGYLPIGKKKVFTEPKLFDDFVGDFFAICNSHIDLMRGVDAELGVWIINGDFFESKLPVDYFNVYVSGGPYYYFRQTCGCDECGREETYGARARAIAYFGDYVSLDVSLTYDAIWGKGIQARLNVSFPFGDFPFFRNTTGDLDISRPVRRQEIIATDERCSWIWNWSSGCDCSLEDL